MFGLKVSTQATQRSLESAPTPKRGQRQVTGDSEEPRLRIAHIDELPTGTKRIVERLLK